MSEETKGIPSSSAADLTEAYVDFNKGDLEKVKMAVRLRKGSVANVNTLLYQWRQRKQKQ